MTSEEFTDRLPRIVGDPSKAFSIKPPFEFNGLSARFFPLRASLDALQQLCNSYVNIVPPEVGRFRAVLPYAYLAVLDYSQISELVAPSGWFAQAEVYFGVPVEWYKVVRGRWVFHDWAVLTPYIFVNDDFSVPLGRTVYGFPKTLARMTPVASQWPSDPAAPVTVARVETAVFPELYQGKKMESRVFLELARNAPASSFRLPFDPHNPMAPWVVASNLAQAFAGLGRDAMWLAQSMRISSVHPGGDPGLVGAMLERLAPAFAPGGAGFILNSLNLKQFPRSDKPEFICYQALTNGPMHATAVNGGGLLGEERALLGDLSGGYTIALHQYSSLPIARTLGLEVDRQWRGDGVDVASLKPVMPFWVNVNVKYERGVNLAWRTRTGIWRGANGEPLDRSPARAADAPLINTTTACAVDHIKGPFRFTGSTVRVLPLLAYRRKLETFLQTRINAAIADSPVHGRRRTWPRVRLSLWARPADKQDDQSAPNVLPDAYVYMTATSLGDVTSGSNNVGDWARYELAFLIPVKWERLEDDGEWSLQGVGFFPAYSFVDNAVAAVSRSEVLGIPTSRATFVSPESVWMKEGAADLDEKQTLLRMDAEVFPAVGVGQQAGMHQLVEITARDCEGGVGDPASPATPVEWATVLTAELEAKKAIKRGAKKACNAARALALELLGNSSPVSLFALKQFRDVVDPGKACYQSLVRVSRTLEEVVDLREIEETLRVRIHDFPGLNPVESLGIFAKPLREEGSGIIYGTQAIRPFYIRATLDELGERILSREGTLGWNLREEAFCSILSTDGPPITLDRLAAQMQDQANPCRMPSVARHSADRRLKDGEFARERQKLPERRRKLAKKRGAEEEAQKLDVRAQELDAHLQSRITKQEARASLAKVDPQMVIESILSREWGNCDENARWRRGRQDLLQVRDTRLSGGSIQFTRPPATGDESSLRDALKQGRCLFADVEKLLYQSVVKDKVNRPGRPPLERPDVEHMILRTRDFTLGRLELECHFNVLAAFSILEAAAPPVAAVSRRDDAETEKSNATFELVRTLELISRTDVIGEPANEHLDPRVRAGKSRLQELVKLFMDVFNLAFPKEFVPKKTFDDYEVPAMEWHSCHTVMATALKDRIEKRFDEQIVDDFQQLTDLLREAVQLATMYCNVQKDALLNKLSRGYQKPDFCIRRDALGRHRDRLLPLSQSWDEDWYYGPTSRDDSDEDDE